MNKKMKLMEQWLTNQVKELDAKSKGEIKGYDEIVCYSQYLFAEWALSVLLYIEVKGHLPER